jgi:hypothetical protein
VEVAAQCKAALAAPEFAAAAEIAAQLGMATPQLENLVQQAAHTGLPLAEWEKLAAACEKQGIGESTHIPQRFVLLRAGISNLPRVAHLPVVDDVKQRLLEMFSYLCAPDLDLDSLLNARHFGFRVMCKFMRLERFPAGQSDWEVSGFPRVWLGRLPARDLARVLGYVYLRAGGRYPFFFPHTAYRREVPILTAAEDRKSVRLMAASMQLQPRIRGYITASWLYDPGLSEVSPHLRWTADWIRECREFGAVYTNIGPAAPLAGFLVGDHRRRKRYESGEWKPVEGVLIWSRRNVLRWAEWDRAQAVRNP